MLAWLCANGALWDVMQVAAWGKMFANYSESMSVSAALRETFDLSKPCEMCSGIAKAREATEQNLPQAEARADAKIVLAMHAVDAPVFGNVPENWCGALSLVPAGRTDPVPVPPPRV